MQEQYLLPGACEAGRQTRAVIAIMLTPPSFLASEDFSQITTDLEFATLTATYDISCQSTFIRHKCGSRVFFFPPSRDFKTTERGLNSPATVKWMYVNPLLAGAS